MKCVICEVDFDYYDESKQCLHCWCISHNLECQCGCTEEELENQMSYMENLK